MSHLLTRAGVSLADERLLIVLEPILGSTSAERVLVYILTRGQGYTREIARFFKSDPDSIPKQLVKLEAGGVLTTKQVGRTLLYEFNPRYPFRQELQRYSAESDSSSEEVAREDMTFCKPGRWGKVDGQVNAEKPEGIFRKGTAQL